MSVVQSIDKSKLSMSMLCSVLTEIKGGGWGGDPCASHWRCCLPTEKMVDERIHTASSALTRRSSLHPHPKLSQDGRRKLLWATEGTLEMPDEEE